MSRARRQPVITDTGPLVALINADDQHHHSCVAWLQKASSENRTIVVPTPVLTEVCYLLFRTSGSDYEARFLEEIAQEPGRFRLHCPEKPDLIKAARLVKKYADLPLGFVDASVVTAAERFGTNEIATVDTRMATVVKLRGREPIVAVP